MCYHFYLEDKMPDELKQKRERATEQKRLLSVLPHHSGVGRHVVGKLGTYLVTVGMRLERIEQVEKYGELASQKM